MLLFVLAHYKAHSCVIAKRGYKFNLKCPFNCIIKSLQTSTDSSQWTGDSFKRKKYNFFRNLLKFCYLPVLQFRIFLDQMLINTLGFFVEIRHTQLMKLFLQSNLYVRTYFFVVLLCLCFSEEARKQLDDTASVIDTESGS